MKCVKFFLGLALVLSGCEKTSDEEMVDLDQMAMMEEEVNQHLAGEPLQSPQELLIKEQKSVE